MRPIVAAAALFALCACGPAAAPVSSGPVGVTTSTASPQGPAQVIGSGDGFHVRTPGELHTVTHDVAAPVERVWQVLPDVYRELGVSASADAAMRTVGTGSVNFTRRMFGEPATRFFDCGRSQFGTAIASTHTVTLTLRTTVQPGVTPQAARLESVAQAYARSNDGANALMSQCRSTGLLEGLIARRVLEKLGAPAAAP